MTVNVLLIGALDPKCEVDLRHPPLGLGYLAAAARERFGPDAFNFAMALKNVEQALDEFRPAVVAISSTSPRFDYARRYARLAAERNLSALVGGIHVSMLPESLYPEMTAGVVGEGEDTFGDLLALYLEAGGFPKERLRTIAGLCFREDDGQLTLTEPRPCIATLDRIPMPDRSMMAIGQHTYMFTSRGCPFKCRFCASTRFWPGRVRFFSAERVVAEIEELATRYGVKIVSFHDDLFVADRRRLEAIGRLLGERKLLGKVRFTCNARANIVDDDLCRVLKSLGVASVNMGLESGSDKTLTWLKGNVTVAQNENAIRCIRKHGMQAQGSFIIGCPDETEADIEETYRFIRRMPLSIADINLLLPYPGTEVWDIALAKGLVSNDMDWGKLTYDVRIDALRYLNLSNHIDTPRLLKIHARFMRLCTWKTLKGMIHHPYKRDLMTWGLRFIGDYFHRRGDR